MKRFVGGLFLGALLAGPVTGGVVLAQGFGWWTAKVTLGKDHKKGEVVQCSTGWATFKTVSCTESAK